MIKKSTKVKSSSHTIIPKLLRTALVYLIGNEIDNYKAVAYCEMTDKS